MTLPVCRILILYATYLCVHVQAFDDEDYYFSTFCEVGKQTNVTEDVTGEGSVKASAISKYPTPNDCRLVLNNYQGYPIELKVTEINLRRNVSSCMDTVEIETSKFSNGPWYTVLNKSCNLSQELNYKNEGPIRIHFMATNWPSSTEGKGFTMAYKTYNPRNFRAIVGGAVGGVCFFGFIAVAMIIYQRKRMIARRTTTVCAPPPTTMVYPVQNPPPGYQQVQQQQQVTQQKTNYYTQPQN